MTRHGPHVVESVPTGTYGTVRCPTHPDLAIVVANGHQGATVIRDHLTRHHTTTDDDRTVPCPPHP